MISTQKQTDAVLTKEQHGKSWRNGYGMWSNQGARQAAAKAAQRNLAASMPHANNILSLGPTHSPT